MVFFTDILPTEIWSEIYKTEHAQNIKFVNEEIKKLCAETKIQNYKLLESWFNMDIWYFGDMQPDGRPLYLNEISLRLWNINKYHTFKNNVNLGVFYV